MRYFVIAPDGSKFGPADIDLLRQWMGEGRIAPDSWLEEEATGTRIRAREVLEFFGTPQSQSTRPEFSRRRDDGSSDVWVSIVCSILGILCCGFFIIGGFVYAKRATAKGNRGGRFAFGFAVVFLLLWIASSIITLMLWNQFMDFIRSQAGIGL